MISSASIKAIPASGITLGGLPLTEIIYDADAPKQILFAARELAAYLKKALKIDLPQHPGKPAAGAFYITTQDHLSGGSYAWDQVQFDRSVTFAQDGTIVLVGENPRSAVYAVYDFLQEFLDIRFFGPGESHEYVPELSALELATDLSHETGSVVELRDYFPRSLPTADFTFKNRANSFVTPGNSEEYGELQQAIHERGGLLRGPGHIWKKFLPDAKLFETEPEIFPVIEGKRQVTPYGACWSNPRAVAEFMNNLRTYIRDGHQFWDIFALWAEDAYYPHYCSCENCAVMTTGEWFMTLVSDIAKVVDEEIPSHIYEFPAYHETRQPPVKVDKLYKDGATMLADLSLGYTRDLWSPLAERKKGNGPVMGMFEAWRDYLANLNFKGKTLVVEYYNWCEVPNMGPAGRCLLWPMDVIQADTQWYVENGYNGISDWICFDTLCWPTPFNVWAWLKIWSNPQVSLEALKDDFYPKYFGTAAAHLRSYIDSVTQQMLPPFSQEGYQQLLALAGKLDAAAQTTTDKQILHRIEVARSHHAFCKLHYELWLAFMTGVEANWLALEQQYRDFLPVTHKDLLTGEVDIPGDWPLLWFEFYAKRGPELIKKLLKDGVGESEPDPNVT